MTNIARSDAGSVRRQTRAGWLLVGFALGGFFDGIVLHQILQWHHLLSGLDGAAGADLPFQVMADGLFHLLMYLVAVTGAVLLVLARAAGGQRATTSQILRLVLIGFGTWHVVDTIVSHWLLGIHRIRMDSDAPLVWDVTWLVLFGLVPLLMAILLPPKQGGGRGSAAAVMCVLISSGFAAGAGPLVGRAAETIVVFRGSTEPAQRMNALVQADARLKWSDATDTIWAVEGVSWSGLATLYANGALLVSTTPLVAGCLAWTERG